MNLFVVLLLSTPVVSAEIGIDWRRVGEPGGAVIGATTDGLTLVTWGDRIERRLLPSGPAQRVGPAASGVCLMDVNSDGRRDIVANERDSGALAWYEAPRWQRHEIDAAVDAPDLIAATLAGRRGVLLIHKRMQLRFYPVPDDIAARWPSRDLYSIYTPAWQGGLATADVDGDGRTDIYCGNYWVRAPERFGLPWRLFAINTWTEEEASGMMRVAPFAGGRGIVMAQRMLPAGRVARFEKPENPTEQWIAHAFGVFHQPDSLEIADLDGDEREDVLVAERGGAGRIVLFRAPEFRAVELRRGASVLALRVVRLAGRRVPDLVLITERAVEYGNIVTGGR